MFRPFPKSARSSAAGVVLGDAPLPPVPGFCNKPPEMAGGGLGRGFAPRAVVQRVARAGGGGGGMPQHAGRMRAAMIPGMPVPGGRMPFRRGPGPLGPRPMPSGPDQQLLQALLFLLENAFKRGNEDVVKRAKAIALSFGLIRLAAALNDGGTKLRLSDLPTAENWPRSDESVRNYVSAQQYARKQQGGGGTI